MNLKKQYIRPEVSKFDIDNSISLVMMTEIPPNPPPRGSGRRRTPRKSSDDPTFKSPFGDKPFE